MNGKNCQRGAGRRAMPERYCSAKHEQAGFTLTEMLAVILILVILVALVVGVSIYIQTEAAKKETLAYQTIIREAVQKYYESTGQWPPQTGASVANRIGNLFDALKGNPAAKSVIVNLPIKAMGNRKFLDGFATVMDYKKSGGLGGTPVIISAGPDRSHATTADNIQSDQAY